MKVLVLSFLVLAASAAPAPDCEDGRCTCILPVVILPGSGGAGSSANAGGLLNNLLLGGILNGGLVNVDSGGLLGGLLGGRRPSTAVGSPVYRLPNGAIGPDFFSDRTGEVSGILNNALNGGIANGGLVNIGNAGETTLGYGAKGPFPHGAVSGILNNLGMGGVLNGGLVNA